MKIKFLKKKDAKFGFPKPLFYLADLLDRKPSMRNLVDKIETTLLRRPMSQVKLNSPIYVSGMARSGTTITTTMLAQHPDTVTHTYAHVIFPYAPYIWKKLADVVPVQTEETERVHQDNLKVNKHSPEAVEEGFWKKSFPQLHDETQSNILTEHHNNSQFIRFYRNIMKKTILLNNKQGRYLTKNNYIITRFNYLLKYFPDVKFVLLVRNPISTIMSSIKQCRIIGDVESQNAKLLRLTQIMGHHEFGPYRIGINLGNQKIMNKVRRYWNAGDEISGWAMYWGHIYEYIYRSLEACKKLKSNSIVVKYEDLCNDSEETIDNILTHTNLNQDMFRDVKQEYAKKLQLPEYYKYSLTPEEMETIKKFTWESASKFGYPEEIYN